MSKNTAIKDISKNHEWFRRLPDSLLVHVNSVLARYAAGNIQREEASNFLEGIKKYKEHSYQRNIPPLPVIWQEGEVKIFHCKASGTGNKSPDPLVVVPSMINSSNILDLLESRSFIRWMADKNFDLYLVDWGTPTEDNGLASLDSVIQRRLIPGLLFLNNHSGRKLNVLGYCMGGTLLTAVAAQTQDILKSLIFLASPWDFHAGNGSLLGHVISGREVAMQMIDTKNMLLSSWVQSVFTAVDPDHAVTKFSRFAEMDISDTEEELFVAVEDWLGDGLDLPADIARCCIDDWYKYNKTVQGKWFLNGNAVDLSDVFIPSIIVASKNDRLVPYESSIALKKNLAHADVLDTNCGHIGMMAGRSAESSVWTTVADWLQSV
jgi:polyhydroxyalkanoate synthase